MRIKICLENANKIELDDLKYQLGIKDNRLDDCTYVVIYENKCIMEYGNMPVYIPADKKYDIKEYLTSCNKNV